MRSNPPALRGTAAVVRLRRDVRDRADLETGSLQRADRGLAARARSLDEDVDLAQTVLLGLAGGTLGGHLRRERRRLARTLETDVAGGRPADHVAHRVGDRDDRVVESALDVRVSVRDVLLLLAPNLLGAGLSGWTRHYFLPAMVFLGPLRVRALVLVRWPWTGRPRRCRMPS